MPLDRVINYPPEQEGLGHLDIHHPYLDRRYFRHAHFIPIVGVGKRGEY